MYICIFGSRPGFPSFLFCLSGGFLSSHLCTLLLLALGVSRPTRFAFFKQIHAVSCGSHALTAALETWSAFASVIACGIASFELLCAWRFRFHARASCATKTSWFSSGLGVEGTSCSRSHNPGGDRTAMLRQGPLFNLSDVSLKIRRKNGEKLCFFKFWDSGT